MSEELDRALRSAQARNRYGAFLDKIGAHAERDSLSRLRRDYLEERIDAKQDNRAARLDNAQCADDACFGIRNQVPKWEHANQVLIGLSAGPSRVLDHELADRWIVELAVKLCEATNAPRGPMDREGFAKFQVEVGIATITVDACAFDVWAVRSARIDVDAFKYHRDSPNKEVSA